MKSYRNGVVGESMPFVGDEKINRSRFEMMSVVFVGDDDISSAEVRKISRKDQRRI